MLTADEILEYASRYIDTRGKDPVRPGEIFAQFARPLDQQKPMPDESAWEFLCFSLCTAYYLDDSAKPLGKWIFMEFWQLTNYPPTKASLRLQPPHIALGKFQNADRSLEIKMVRWNPPLIHGNTISQAYTPHLNLSTSASPNPNPESVGTHTLEFPAKQDTPPYTNVNTLSPPKSQDTENSGQLSKKILTFPLKKPSN